MFAQTLAAASGFDSDEFHPFVFNEVKENADRIRAAADTSDNASGQLAFGFKYLCSGFFSDYLVKVADHCRIRMRPQDAAEKIMSGANVGYPIAHGLIDSVFQGARPRLHAAYFGPKQAHAEN